MQYRAGVSPSVTLQTRLGDTWHDAASLEFQDPHAGIEGRIYFEYQADYAIGHGAFEDPLPRGAAAVGWNYPVTLNADPRAGWPAFLDDLRPGGAAERHWATRLGMGFGPELDHVLIHQATAAPIGNVRVAESVPERPNEVPRFDAQDVVERHADFLDYAAQLGAEIGGATGAGGDAPKLLLRLDEAGRVWIDPWQDDATSDRHVLVKFARGARTARDRIVLESEAVYLRVLAHLGFDAVTGELRRSTTGQPSLWLERFDRVDGRFLGVESLYSLIEARPGSHQSHRRFLEALLRVVRPEDPADLVAEYVARDLVDVLLGNSDNHGRNRAVLKQDESITLAPMFDVAPMKMDPEGIVRSTRWDDELRGFDWRAIVDGLADLAPADRVWDGLRERAGRLSRLYEACCDAGLPEETRQFSPIGLPQTRAKLERWGLL